MLEQVKSAQERWQERAGSPRMPPTPSQCRNDAVAVIYRPARSAMTSGKARTREWKLRFEPRSPRYIEPLMGWTGSNDVLSQVELSFPSMEEAAAYARRQGLNFVIRGLADVGANVRHMADVKSRPWRLEWVERTLGPEVIKKGVQPGTDPSAGYADPKDVLADPALTKSGKRDVLQRWALDAYLIEMALSKGHPISHQSRLEEVIDALIDLDEDKTALIAQHAPARAERAAV